MSRSRCCTGLFLAFLVISLVFLGGPDIGRLVAAAEPQPNVRALQRVMEVQDRNTQRLLAVKGVVGTATGLNPAAKPVIKVFTVQPGVAGIPRNLGGVPVVVEVTGEFFALAKPPSPPGLDKNKAPEVTIVSPTDGSTFDSGVEITFEGTATDKEDGDLSASLIWLSSRVAEPIGSGSEFSTTLGDGFHTITASATDKGGKTGSASITITVGSAGPFERPAPIGVSTGNALECSAGTIGCRVIDTAGDVYALSNNHVYARENKAGTGELIVQPGLYDTACEIIHDDQYIGSLADYEPIKFDGSANTIDAAIAVSTTDDVGTGTPSDGYGVPSSTVRSAELGLAVQKYGRTTGLTKGIVSGINATVNVGYSSGTARFVDQIIVEARRPFIKAGDSGSLLVTDPDRAPVGLLFAGNGNGKLAVANDIGLVLGRFVVTVDGE